MIILDLQELKQIATTKPSGYLDDIIAKSSKVTEHYIELSIDNYDQLCKKYRKNYITIYDRINKQLESEASTFIHNKNLPGEVFLRFLEKFGLHISLDCPCRKKIEFINKSDINSLKENLIQIIPAIMEESHRFDKNVSRDFIEKLFIRSLDFSLRHKKSQTQSFDTKETNNPDGVGTELKNLLAKWPFNIVATPNCSCNARAAEMNRKGIDWCESNIDTITGWLKEEAEKRGLLFIDFAAKLLVKKAIKNAKRNQL